MTTRALLLLFALAYLALHLRAGYSFPPPWSDEAAFLWQARAVQEHNSLFAPQLTAEWHVMWMPPGYMLLVGLFFKLVGASLATARWLSAGLMLLSFVLLARLWRAFRYPLLLTALTGLFWLGRPFIIAGNIARPEALLLLFVVLALFLFYRRRPLAALALLLLAPLVHPNGVYFLVAGGVVAVVEVKRQPASSARGLGGRGYCC